MGIQIVKSKYAKTLILMKKGNLKSYIPHTRKLTKPSLTSMLSDYKMVYVKPDLGKGGAGVMRVEKLPGKLFNLKFETRSIRYDSINSLYKGIIKHKIKGPYVVQQGIKLLKHRNRPFDIRVMVQLNPKGRWEPTGVIGRLAHPARVVTNYHSGGTPLAYETLMKSHLTNAEQRKQLTNFHKLGVSVARHLYKRYPGIKEVGLDIALDSHHHPWLLEVNTLPDPFIFLKLKDKSVFRKISRYATAYGRFEKRYCPGLARKKKALRIKK